MMNRRIEWRTLEKKMNQPHTEKERLDWKKTRIKSTNHEDVCYT